MVKKWKNVPRDCRWMEWEGLREGRTCVVFERREWWRGLVDMMEWRKQRGGGGGEGGREGGGVMAE